MTTRKLARVSGLYYEEFEIGDSVESVSRTITETDIVNFAALSGDWNLIHTDAEYSKAQMFGLVDPQHCQWSGSAPWLYGRHRHGVPCR